MRILVTTPTGHIGSRIVDRLLTSEHELVLLARDPGKLGDAARTAAAVVPGAIEDADAIATALAGVDAAFLLIPPPPPTIPDWRAWQEGLGRQFAAAARQAGVARVVFLSSTGAQHDDIGAISGAGVIERTLQSELANVLVIRAGYFMENYLNSLGTIAAQGVIYGVVSPDIPMHVVATRDIGDVAVRWLADGSWRGHHVVGSHGPEALTQAQAAATLAAVFGRPVQYVQIPAPAFRDALLGAGAPPLVADGYELMMGGIARHLDAGDYSAEPQGSHGSAGATSLRQFATEVLRSAYDAQALAAA